VGRAYEQRDTQRQISRPKISEKADPKLTSGAWVAFSTSSRPIFCY
jgi:hypothetical protein